jgi:hypothetical protein
MITKMEIGKPISSKMRETIKYSIRQQVVNKTYIEISFSVVNLVTNVSSDIVLNTIWDIWDIRFTKNKKPWR